MAPADESESQIRSISGFCGREDESRGQETAGQMGVRDESIQSPIFFRSRRLGASHVLSSSGASADGLQDMGNSQISGIDPRIKDLSPASHSLLTSLSPR